MFTGIVETLGKVESVQQIKGNLQLLISSDISNELRVDQSVAHNGVCLTVEDVDDSKHSVTAIAETISRTNLDGIKEGDLVNLERCLKIGDRLDGHTVQGHVDDIAITSEILDADGSKTIVFEFDPQHANLLVSKGSITINGVSLTLIDVIQNKFSVAIIPYTNEHTTFQFLEVMDKVNLEFDILGKYVLKRLQNLPKI